MTTIEVYTHPTCVTCGDAVEAARALEDRRDDVEVRIVSLATDKGRERAKEEQVLVVPTVIVGDQRVQAAPSEEELEEMLREAST